jgi:hypothetical protein
MAIYLRGMTDQETTDMTLSLIKTGETADLSNLGATSVDKHSTGGVGDKVSLPIYIHTYVLHIHTYIHTYIYIYMYVCIIRMLV